MRWRGLSADPAFWAAPAQADPPPPAPAAAQAPPPTRRRWPWFVLGLALWSLAVAIWGAQWI
jgi:hypothetical protein